MCGFLGKEVKRLQGFVGDETLTMEWWEDGTNYLSKEILVLFVFRRSLSFTSSLQQPQFKPLAYLLPLRRKSRRCFTLLLFK